MSSSHLAPACLSVTLLLAACDAGSSSAPADGGKVVPSGCSPQDGPPPSAPGGYYVNGNTLCTPGGKPHLLHGVDRPSLEWDPEGEHLSANDFAQMASWGANVVRIALNQGFWLSDSPRHVPTYAARVDQAVTWAEEAGLDVILDLHWSDRGDYTVMPGQQPMADTHSLAFWQEVAARYQGDGRVFFELYNEPHDVPASVWLWGGEAAGFTVAGMQQLHDAVRSTGANNPVIVGGLDWAYDLSHVTQFPVKGYNILYATHPYNNAPERVPGRWEQSWGFLTETSPVVVTEFGDATGSCSPDYDRELIAFADAHHASWTAWAWWAGSCNFPALLSDWTGTTTQEGAVVKAALLGYTDPEALPPRDAGAAADDGAADAGEIGDADSPG